jgi:peptidoglycan/xylan/chitin deacetylase (PgdA/CDA1 family)
MATFHLRYPGGLNKALTFSYDDGVEQDIRLVEIFNKNGLKGTFNINTGSFAEEGTVYKPGVVHRRMTKQQTYDLFANSPHEVAVHTLNHPFLEQLPTNMVVHEVLNDRKNIEEMFGKVTRGMAYPFGTTSDAVVEALRMCGILYSRTTKATNSLELQKEDWLRLSATCHHKSPMLNELGDKLINEQPARAPWLMYVWGHSYEFEGDNNWEIIENFCEKVGNRDDIWYATNIEIYEYITAYYSLVFSATGDTVYNPTATELFFYDSRAKKCYSVKPGETKKLF